MDAISCHNAGFKNVVAVSGTALTTAQLALIKRYTKNIILAFDQDSAGVNATDRGINEALKSDFRLKVAIFPIGKDPDEIIRENPEIFKKGIEEALDIMRYYMEREFKGVDMSDVRQKNKAIQKVLEIIAKLYNKVEQDFWIKELLSLSKVDESSLREELNKIIKKEEKNESREADRKKDNNLSNSFVQLEELSWVDKLMENLLSLLLKFNDHFSYVSNNLDLNFVSGRYREFYNYALIYYNKNKKIDYLGLLEALESEKQEDLAEVLKKLALISEFYQEQEDFSAAKAKEEIIKNILDIKRNFFKETLKLENDKLMLAERKADNEAITESLKRIKDLNDELKKIM
jgi:DNA primase